eukprot:278044-Ditylum_brightwellii.AAC.1
MTISTRSAKQSRKADTTNQGSKETEQTQTAQGGKDQKETKKNRNDGRGCDNAAAVMGSTTQIDGAGSPSQRS